MAKNTNTIPPSPLLILPWLLFIAEPAWATQGHGEPEGLYAHQLAHVFFMISMGILIYWLRERKLVKQIGWRYIQYAAFFFILWNMVAFAVHTLEGLPGVLQIAKIDPWRMRVDAGGPLGWLSVVYYFAKLDHLLCAPAMFFLYAGLKKISMDADFVRRGGGR
ncbi:MAG: hypothetical protein GY859_15820 [Desulfobacterales bacterium]|nr:hypothetical protein [Desulfobacterales bacterium]